MIVPMASVVSGLIDFVVSCGAVLVVFAWYGILPGFAALALPFFVALVLATSLGVALGLSSLTALYRDFEHTVPFLAQFWFFITPVVYPTALIPERWRWMVGLNPMAGALDGIRGCLLGTPISWPVVITSAGVAFCLLVVGAGLFGTLEKQLIDRV
jgi:lipopolysaccharide transport system permease protein